MNENQNEAQPAAPHTPRKTPADSVLQGSLSGVEVFLVLDAGTSQEVMVRGGRGMLREEVQALLHHKVQLEVRRGLDPKKHGCQYQLRRMPYQVPAPEAGGGAA